MSHLSTIMNKNDKLWETDKSGQLTKYNGVDIPPNVVVTIARTDASHLSPRREGGKIIKSIYRLYDQLMKGWNGNSR